MSDIMDWAEESFNEIYRSILNDHLEVSKPLVLAALRKAKADGLRMAAEMAEDPLTQQRLGVPTEWLVKSFRWVAEDVERAAADTLQHNEGKG